ncbi:MAG TPA: TIGR03435 family protein [Candidatus Aquilonibacter sp.]|nr:TIGR03435 family protein [Candidatus Aquilonibacter sp.]
MTQTIGLRKPSLALVLFAAATIGAHAQTTAPQTAQSAAPSFDVASIHPHTPQPHERNHLWSSSNDGNFRTQNVTLKAIIQYAFNMPESRIIGAPAWTASQPFDIDAKSDDALNQRLHDLPSDQAKPIKLAMIQSLLADRFGLKTHREQRDLPIYELVVAKGGPKLEPSKSGGLTINHWNNRFSGQGITMPIIAQELARDAGRVILDKTGITGRFDIDLRWQPDDAPPTGNDAAYPPFFTALQEQLGLRLEPAKGPVDVLVIDDVHPPTAN